MRDNADEPQWALRYADIKPARRLSRASLRSVARYATLMLAGAVADFREHSFLRCLMLHSVFDDQRADFRRLLTRIQEVGRFVSTEDVVQMSKGEKPIDGRCFHLSFDDGFDNNYRNAVPILSELGIPAAFFVPTRFIVRSDAEVIPPWWLRVKTSRPTRPLQWAWLSEMVKLGHDVGSHTRSHACLSDISNDPDRLRQEIAGSKDDLEQKLGVACRYLAWPYGTERDIDQRSAQCIEKSGYEACFSSVRGAVPAGEGNLFAIRRHQFAAEWPWLHVRFFVAGGGEAR